MTATQSHGGITKRERKRAAISFGEKILRLEVGSSRRHFVAHEDLICSRSTFFRDHFQPGRKDIEGECVICTEELQDPEKDVTFCNGCGKNIHNKCILQWKTTKNSCPMCRTEWVNKNLMKRGIFGNLDPDAFDMYVQWIYRQCIPKYKADKDSVKDCCYRLIEAHILGETLNDANFQHAIREEIIESSLSDPKSVSQDMINLVYDSTDGGHVLRKLVVDLYALVGNLDWLSDAKDAPQRFIVDLAQAYVRKSQPRPSDEDVRKLLADNGYIEQDNTSPE